MVAGSVSILFFSTHVHMCVHWRAAESVLDLKHAVPTRHLRRDVNFAMGSRPQERTENIKCSVQTVFTISELDEITQGENRKKKTRALCRTKI